MTQEKKSFAESWQGMFGTLEYQEVQTRSELPLIVDFTEGGNVTITARELAQLVYNGNRGWMLSANGTIFSQDRAGIIPQLLARWYADRKKLQAEMKNQARLADEETDPDKKAEYQKLTAFYDQRQLIQKILLNSLYGAIGNNGSRFFDERVAQSVTLSGRCIVKHMQSKINEIITGTYDHLGASCIYGDTDSGYFSAYPVMKNLAEFQDFAWTKEAVVDLYDKIADLTNDSFPEFMNQAFNCPQQNGAIIRAGRELCAERGIFIKKKRYAVLIFDKEGKRKDTHGKPGEIKAMGLDLKRSDTPRVVQEFLMSVLTQVLVGSDQQQVIQQISDFRKDFTSWPGWIKGTPKRVNKLSFYQQAKAQNETWGNKNKKTNLPGHVQASLNWNRLLDLYNDHSSMKIQDGAKIIVCKLRDNPLNMTSVAYPIDQDHLPEWFKQLPWDHAEMETALIDKKIKNLLGVLNWDLDSSRKRSSAASLFF